MNGWGTVILASMAVAAMLCVFLECGQAAWRVYRRARDAMRHDPWAV